VLKKDSALYSGVGISKWDYGQGPHQAPEILIVFQARFEVTA
jgi:hypothetical protein